MGLVSLFRTYANWSNTTGIHCQKAKNYAGPPSTSHLKWTEELWNPWYKSSDLHKVASLGADLRSRILQTVCNKPFMCLLRGWVFREEWDDGVWNAQHYEGFWCWPSCWFARLRSIRPHSRIQSTLESLDWLFNWDRRALERCALSQQNALFVRMFQKACDDWPSSCSQYFMRPIKFDYDTAASRAYFCQ